MSLVTTATSERSKLIQWLLGITVAASIWLFAYSQLIAFADWVIAMLGLTRQTRTGEALHFFFYDSPKVVLLLTGIVFIMGIIQTFFSPERTRAMLTGKREGVGNVLAASLGIVTPFCSCSAVPLFIGFLSAGVPLGVTFSFLISAPMVNEVALVLLFGMFGWKVAALYLGLGLLVAIIAGLVIGKLKMERFLEEWVQKILGGQTAEHNGEQLTWVARFQAGGEHVKEIVGKVWPYILAGIALGAGIHGYVPEDFMASFMGKDVHQRRRYHPDRRSADRQGCGTRYGAGLHDECHRTLGTGNDHPAQGAQADADCYLCRRGRHRHSARWLRV